MEIFSITWYVQNFHFCWHKTGEWLLSPKFSIEDTSWRLLLYPRGEDDGEFISYYLCREEGGPPVMDINFDFYLEIGEIGLKLPISFSGIYSFQVHQRAGVKDFALRWELTRFSNNQKDISLCCRIYSPENRSPIIMPILTRIEVERIHGTEFFEIVEGPDHHFNKDFEVKPLSEEKPLLVLNFSYVQDGLVVKVRPVSCEKIKYAIGKITLIKSCCKDSPVERVRYWVGGIKADVWKYYLPFRKTCSSKQDDFKTITCKALFVHYDFMFSTGEKSEAVGTEEWRNYRNTLNVSFQQYLGANPLTDNPFPTSLDALEDEYTLESFADLTLKAKKGIIPLNKAILCARSSTLNYVIDSDDTEIKIKRLRDIEGQSLAVFLYYDIVKFSSLFHAGELFSIASCLNIELLKTKCRNFLKDNLDLFQVGGILRILRAVEDLPLKSAVENFILTRYDLVLRTMDWRVLEDEPELKRELLLLKYKRQKSIQLCNVNL